VEAIKIRYQVRTLGSRNKEHVVEKCTVHPSNREPGGYYHPFDVVDRLRERDWADAKCERLNADQEAMEKLESR
jgi:hypothetical protein